MQGKGTASTFLLGESQIVGGHFTGDKLWDTLLPQAVTSVWSLALATVPWHISRITLAHSPALSDPH